VQKYEEKVIETVELPSTFTRSKNASLLYLRIDGDFRPGQRGGTDAANFYYSLDGKEFTKIGSTDYKMRFDWRRFFMGSKFAIFNYATKRAGGYVDVDSFNYQLTSEK
jgi:hypothetical protein